VRIEGEPYTVIGVAPRSLRFPSDRTALWIPMRFDRGNLGAFWGSGGHAIIGRLRDGITVEDARADVRAAYAEVRLENPIWNPGPEYRRDARVDPLQSAQVATVRPTLLMLLGVVLLVLLIACVNVANLLLVRLTARSREFAIRTAVGGGRSRLIRQLVTESAVLAALGGVLGLLVAWGGLRWMRSALPAELPNASGIALDVRVLAFTAGLAVLTAVVIGSLPAWRALDVGRLSALAWRGTSRGLGSRRLSSALVAAEIALAVIVVTGAQLLIRSFVELRRVHPGFVSESLVTAKVSPPASSYEGPERRIAFLDAVTARTSGLSGVAQVAAVSAPPLHGGTSGMAVRIQGQAEDLRNVLPTIEGYAVITPDYPSTMGIPLVRGRPLTAGDRADSPEGRDHVIRQGPGDFDHALVPIRDSPQLVVRETGDPGVDHGLV
jgi:predicted permease